MHLSDEDLILHFYSEHASRDEESRVDEHLRSCPTCRESWEELQETLSLVDAARVPEPADHFERLMWARVQRGLPAIPAATAWWRERYVLAVAAAVLVAAGASFTTVWRSHRAAPAIATAPAVTGTLPADAALRARERVLLTAVGDHLQQTELVLVELMNGPEGSRADLAFERLAADDLVSSGRLYRVTAQQNGDAQLALMLDDFQSVLVEVARFPEGASAKQVRSLRDRITEDDLLFKVRAASNAVHVRQKQMILADE